MCEIIAFVGGAGSPGKTFLTHNTAVALTDMGLSVTILDIGQTQIELDFEGGNQWFYDVNDFLAGACPLQDLRFHMHDNLDLISLGDVGDYAFRDKISALIPMEGWLKSRDFLLIDTPSWICQSLPELVREASDIYTVIRPEQIAAGDVYTLVHSICNSIGNNRMNIILNRVLFQGLADMVCDRLESDLHNLFNIEAACAAYVPEETDRAETSRRKGLPNVVSSDSEAFVHVGHLAERIIYYRRMPRLADNLENMFRILSLSPKIGNPLRYQCEEPSDGNDADSLSAEVRMFREIIVGALGCSEYSEAEDFKGLYRSVRTLMERARWDASCMGQPSAPPGH